MYRKKNRVSGGSQNKLGSFGAGKAHIAND